MGVHGPILWRLATGAGRTVIVDDKRSWRGLDLLWGALALAKEIERTAADLPLRKRLRELGVRFITDAAVREWRGDAAVVTQFAGPDEVIAADTLVVAACNRPEDGLAHELVEMGIAFRSIGDSVAARTAVMAIYEGRVTGMEI